MTRKTTSFEGWSWLRFSILGLALIMAFKCYSGVAKRLKLKVRKFWRPVLTFVEVTGEKLVGGDFLVSTPILNRDKYFLNLGIPSWLNCFSDFSKKIFFIFNFILYICFNSFMLLYFIFVILFFVKYESKNILLYSASLYWKDIALLQRKFATCTSSSMCIKSSLYLVPFRTPPNNKKQNCSVLSIFTFAES